MSFRGYISIEYFSFLLGIYSELELLGYWIGAYLVSGCVCAWGGGVR